MWNLKRFFVGGLETGYSRGEEDGLAKGTGGTELSDKDPFYIHGRLLAAVVRLEEKVKALEHNQLDSLRERANPAQAEK